MMNYIRNECNIKCNMLITCMLRFGYNMGSWTNKDFCSLKFGCLFREENPEILLCPKLMYILATCNAK